MSSFDLTILGSSSALPTPIRFSTAHLLKVDERFFLIDCGEGCQVRLRKFGFNPGRIHHIFISHLHGDHVFGLFGLLSSMGMLGRKVPLHLYGPETLEPMMKQHFSFFGELPFDLEFHTPGKEKGAKIFEDDRMSVTPIKLRHRTTTFGYLFREKPKALNVRKESIEKYGLGIADVVKIKNGADFINAKGETIPNQLLTHPPFKLRSYAYISDTDFEPSIAEQVRGVDLLFHEATFLGKDEKLARQTLHSTAPEAARIALEAGVERLLIGHFSTRYKDQSILEQEAREIFEATFGVNDGDCFSVEQRRETTE